MLIRLTGCQMRCTWCDTPYAFHQGEWLSLDEVMDQVADFGCPLVELTGGEPLLQPAAIPLLHRLCESGYEVLLETGGGLDISAVDPRVHRILDIKCPGSGEAENNHWPNLQILTERDELKLVISHREDYEWARDLLREHRLAERCPVHFSPMHGSSTNLQPQQPGLDPAELARWILEDRLPVRLQVQVHKVIWDATTRGV